MRDSPTATVRKPPVPGRAEAMESDASSGGSTAETSEAVFAVEGIHCASCVQLIEMQVGGVRGVARVDVGLASHRARVRWDARIATLADITAAIARAGYRAWPVSAVSASSLRSRERRMALWRLFVAGFSMMQVMMYATPAYLAIDGEMEPDIEKLLRIASFVLTVPVIFYSAAPLITGAWRHLARRRIGMDVPASLGLLVTFAASTWNTFLDTGPVYFDSVSMFVFFLLGGRYLERMARERAGAAVEELARMQPAHASLMPGWPASPTVVEVAAGVLAPGDVVLVCAGNAIPADGVVVAGTSLADEALISGESRPVTKTVGSEVTGGAINLVAPLTVRVRAAAADSHLAHLMRLVETASSAKPAITELADRYAATFLWAILLLAGCAAVAWSLTDPARALPAAVAVLIVTCPCALSLAAPVALSSAVGNLARRGVLVVRGNAIETLARATHFVFDKTGTLTTGRMKVEEVILLGEAARDEVLGWGALMERAAVHPVAQAIAMAGAPHAARIAADRISDAREIAGRGVEARIDGQRVRLGSIDFVAELAGPLPARARRAESGAASVAAMGREGAWTALVLLGDGVRSGGPAMIERLKAAGARVVMASGDTPGAAAAAARTLGIARVHAGMTPEAKHALVAGLQRGGAIVAMVGDGINDAPVLALADVSIALGSGAPLAQTRADMVLMSGDPADLLEAIETARRTLRIVAQNIAWAAVYNLVAIPLAATGQLAPWMAGLGMSLSSAVVVLNSLRVARRRRPAPPAAAVHANPGTAPRGLVGAD